MNSDKRQLVRIVPAPNSSPCAARTQGTKVMLGDVEIPHVERIHLFAWPNDVWRADITVLCDPPEIQAGALVEVSAPLSWWRRLLLRLAGVETVEVTTMGSRVREFARP